jgi:DNA-binding transcriptional LysR family regulator
MKSPGLSDLEAFAAVARTGSFRRAATERGVSASALSQSVRSLEERLGLRLLNRTTRSVALTQAGERLLDRLRPALQEIAEAIDDVNSFRATPSGAVRINAPAPAIDHVLMPVLARFLRAYPEISVEFKRDEALVDIVEQGFDAGVRFGEELARDMIAMPIGPRLRYAVAVSPELIERYGVPRHPKDLLARPCVRYRFSGGTMSTWTFEKDGEIVAVSPEGRVTLGDPRHALRAAIDGLGFIRLLREYVREAIAEGQLVEVLADWNPMLPSWYLYYPSRRHVPAAMRAFLDFLVRQKW